MKPFTKHELISLGIIFLLLAVISVPNFVLSLRRARDQTRRDDIGTFQSALDAYYGDFKQYPLSTPDGKILACIAPGTSVQLDKHGKLVADLVPCKWGHDAFVDLTPGSTKVYMSTLPGDPQLDKGVSYTYFSDGDRFQVFASLEGGESEIEYSQVVAARKLLCGNRICNLGRGVNVPINMTIEEYDTSLLGK